MQPLTSLRPTCLLHSHLSYKYISSARSYSRPLRYMSEQNEDLCHHIAFFLRNYSLCVFSVWRKTVILRFIILVEKEHPGDPSCCDSTHFIHLSSLCGTTSRGHLRNFWIHFWLLQWLISTTWFNGQGPGCHMQDRPMQDRMHPVPEQITSVNPDILMLIPNSVFHKNENYFCSLNTLTFPGV
jgi:hypothetical protein